MDDFHEGQPIFVQIRQRLIGMILSGMAKAGDALPSVRQIAADLSVNPLTVTRAFEALVDTGAVEKRRGLGMYVKEGAREVLLRSERDRFLRSDWPRILEQINALGLTADELLVAAESAKDSAKGHEQ